MEGDGILNGIRLYREKLGITQQQLAKMMGLYQSTIAMWEAGNRLPRSDKLPELAKALGCSIDDLYDSKIA